ncbi:hypothetical protein [Nostoc sp. WHI]|uniref:hypothetical protein n=1 Tax=Nostoc sp. WHI TaxID=2650611 RepID=UPI0018C494B3|nr:hypothetical protein [Nostoc sp. WHI]MBG1265721.1 hypothetical protein [Nostoc sp. WHI]
MVKIFFAIAFLSHAKTQRKEEESDRTLEILQAIAFLSHAEEEGSDAFSTRRKRERSICNDIV